VKLLHSILYHFIKYYYRADGSLAKIQARLNTFYGGVSVLRDRYYDGNGKLLKSTQRFLDLQTHKPIKKKDWRHGNSNVRTGLRFTIS